MLQNIWPLGCNNCKASEMLSGESLRNLFAQNYNEYLKNQPPKLLEIEIDSSNRCNFACVHCSLDFSDKWAKYEILLQQNGFNSLRNRNNPSRLSTDQRLLLNRLMEIDLSTIKLIRFKGGEPFLNKEITEFLDFFDEKGFLSKVDIHCVTNGSIINLRLLKLFARAKSVSISISVDGPDEVQQYIRYGASELKKTENFIWACKDLPAVKIDFLVSIMVYNIFSLPEIASWWHSLKLKYSEINIAEPWFSHFVNSPKYLSIRTLPDDCRQNLINLYERQIDADYDHVIQMLKQPWIGAYWHSKFIKFTKILEGHRNNRIISIIPQLSPYMNEFEIDKRQLAKDLIFELNFMIEKNCATPPMYLQRGLLKNELNDKGANEDFKKAIELDANLFDSIPDFWLD